MDIVLVFCRQELPHDTRQMETDFAPTAAGAVKMQFDSCFHGMLSFVLLPYYRDCFARVSLLPRFSANHELAGGAILNNSICDRVDRVRQV